MKIKVYLIFLFILCISCTSEDKSKTKNQNKNHDEEMVFDKDKWNDKDGKDYIFRNKMVNNVIYNDTIRSLNKSQLIALLGEPDYKKEEHLYYRIKETRLGNWALKTKTMVIKLVGDNKIDWIKIHE